MTSTLVRRLVVFARRWHLVMVAVFLWDQCTCMGAPPLAQLMIIVCLQEIGWTRTHWEPRWRRLSPELLLDQLLKDLLVVRTHIVHFGKAVDQLLTQRRGRRGLFFATDSQRSYHWVVVWISAGDRSLDIVSTLVELSIARRTAVIVDGNSPCSGCLLLRRAHSTSQEEILISGASWPLAWLLMMLVLLEQISVVLLLVSSQRREAVLVSVLTWKLSMSGAMRMAQLLLSQMLLLLLVSHWDLVVEDTLSSILHINFLSLAERKSASDSSVSFAVKNVVAWGTIVRHGAQRVVARHSIHIHYRSSGVYRLEVWAHLVTRLKQ